MIRINLLPKHCSFAKLNIYGRCIANCAKIKRRLGRSADCTGQLSPTIDQALKNLNKEKRFH